MKRFGLICIFSIMLASAGVFAVDAQAYAVQPIFDGMVVRGGGPEVYVMENGMRRWIVDEEAFSDLSLSWEGIVPVADEDLARYPKGKSILAKSKYPEGMLLRADGTKVYLVTRGARRWITNENEFNALRLDWRAIMDVPMEKMKTLQEGKPIVDTREVIRPLTVLLDTPDASIEDTSASFYFNGISARGGAQMLTFDTFLESVDSGWVSARGERTVRVPAKSGSYRFFVRAKDSDGVADAMPESFAFTVRLSPYYGSVVISSVNAKATDPMAEQVTLQGKAADEPVVVTGWKLGSEQFHTSYVIPDAFEIPNHPFLEKKKDIVMDAKSKVTIYTGKSASGMNFQINNCVGYLKSYYTFTPPLPSVCPRISSADTGGLDAYCRKVISSSVGACKEPNLNDMLITAECRNYLKEHVNYSKCVEENYAYYDFFKNEWRVYLGYSGELWSNEGDTITLRDSEGLLAAKYKY